ncbi:MAG: epimerase [Rhodobacteraceae bacterium]|nr:epimerase [Paracoccaceae bacterium]
MTGTVLILGASGVFGAAAAHAFAAAGWQVRRFDRKTGDMIRDATGADVIVNAMNPPAYHDWKTLLPQITAQVIAAAKATGATVILPGNVYVSGDQVGPWDENTPHRPVARKGRIRAELEAAYRNAAAEGLRTIVLRGGDFIDPGNMKTILDMVTLKGLAKGRITAMGRPDVRRAYAYIPDMTRAAVALAEMRDRLPPFADVAFPGVTFSLNELKQALEMATGKTLRIGNFPWWMMRLASPVWELARELSEMRYLYNTPHTLSGATFHRLLPDFRLTALDRIAAEEAVAMGAVPSGQVKIHPDQTVA